MLMEEELRAIRTVWFQENAKIKPNFAQLEPNHDGTVEHV
jgi:hypothetical protein